MTVQLNPVPFEVMEAVNRLLATFGSAITAAEHEALSRADAEGQRAMQALEQEREANQESRAAFDKLIEGLQSRLAELSGQLTEATAARDAYRDELASVRHTDGDISSALEQMQGTLAQVTAERDSLAAQLATSLAEARAAAADLAKVSTERDLAVAGLEAIRAELASLRAERDTACDRAARAEGAAEALRGLATARREPLNLSQRRRG